MVDAKITRKRDRRESNLLLNAVLAHMAYSTAKNDMEREATHERFAEAVRKLSEFLTVANSAKA